MKKPSRRALIGTMLALLIILLLAYAFRSPPVLVDGAQVARADFRITVEEEGRTRVPDRYQVTAPIGGFMGRVRLEPGDAVKRGEPLFTLAAHALDPRSQTQAQAMLARADAAVQAARTQVDSEQARKELADAELQRVARLVQAQQISAESLDRAQAEARRAAASLRSANFMVEVARHERDNARAALDVGSSDAASFITVSAPVDGVVLNRTRQSEGPVQAGEPVLSLGDLASLEVEVDVLSPDAVRMRPGMRVELERWGGDQVLSAQIRRIEPAGFTRYSALGVEEQRVWIVVELTAPRSEWQSLGDGYRVEARFILTDEPNVLQVPASALFREGSQWAAYVVEEGTAVKRAVVPGRRSGLISELREGLNVGETVIMHPPENIKNGVKVNLR